MEKDEKQLRGNSTSETEKKKDLKATGRKKGVEQPESKNQFWEGIFKHKWKNSKMIQKIRLGKFVRTKGKQRQETKSKSKII